jgi:hypothetical protein
MDFEPNIDFKSTRMRVESSRYRVESTRSARMCLQLMFMYILYYIVTCMSVKITSSVS